MSPFNSVGSLRSSSRALFWALEKSYALRISSAVLCPIVIFRVFFTIMPPMLSGSASSVSMVSISKSRLTMSQNTERSKEIRFSSIVATSRPFFPPATLQANTATTSRQSGASPLTIISSNSPSCISSRRAAYSALILATAAFSCIAPSPCGSFANRMPNGDAAIPAISMSAHTAMIITPPAAESTTELAALVVLFVNAAARRRMSFSSILALPLRRRVSFLY